MSEKLLHYFKGDELAANVWQSKYAAEGEETPDDMHRRMSKEFATIEGLYQQQEIYVKEHKPSCNELSKYGKMREDLNEEKIFNLFKDFKYIIPQGSIMATLGTEQIASLSNCWVIESPLDSYAGIHKADGDLIYYYKRRGGVGVDISNLRPANTETNNAAKTTTGAVSFMHRFSNTTREVAMNGRRGALMISIDINHPDVMDFIKVKRDGTSVTGANISIRLNNEFMKAVENDEKYVLRFPCNFYEKNPTWVNDIEENKNEAELNVLQPIKYQNEIIGYTKVIKAKEYWDEIVKSARNHAEPGLMYWDNALEYDPAGVYEQYKPISTNPCGEQFLQANDSCRLMVHNLFNYVDEPFTENAKFNEELFYKNAYECMRLGDDLVDLESDYIQRIIDKINSDPEPDDIKRHELELWIKSQRICQEGRRVGIGITALGDTLAALNVKYDSEEGLDIIANIMKIKMEAELDCTIDLAILRGTFEGWDPIKETGSFYHFLDREFPEQASRMDTYGRRNISWSTIAPTGSVSLLADNCTSGCEPLFQPFYMRRKKINPGEAGVRVDFVDEVGDSWQEFAVLHPKFKEWITIAHPHFVEGDIPEMSKEDLQQCFEESPWYGSTANDIDWKKRVEIQAILQKYTTNAISSTINLPSTVTYEEVSDIYMYGWEKGLKGQTVYVDGSRSGVLITENSNKSREEFNYIDATKRPKELPCKVHVTSANGVKYNVFVGLMNDKAYEVFVTNHFTNEDNLTLKKIKKGRYDLLKNGETYSEDITTEMSDEQEAITRLVSTSLRHGADIKFIVEQLSKTSEGNMFGFTRGLARVLKKYIPDGAKSTVSCNDCGSSNVVFEEGCNKCRDCGSSKCG